MNDLRKLFTRWVFLNHSYLNFLIVFITNRFVEAWKANDHINEALLDYLSIMPVKSKTQEAHLLQEFSQMLRVRLLWLEENRMLTMDEIITIKVGKGELDSLKFALAKSSAAISTLIKRGSSDHRIRGFKSPSDFVNYLVSAESQTRNKIVLLLAYPN